jgi:hypothetical protein
MNKRQRKMLARLQEVCNELGSTLDYSAVSKGKLIDRQKALMDVSKVLYGVLCDDPENDQREYDLEQAEAALKRIEKLPNISYPDINGFMWDSEKNKLSHD